MKIPEKASGEQKEILQRLCRSMGKETVETSKGFFEKLREKV